MKFVDVVVLLYAILTIVMGILGYAAPTTGHPSLISLIAGGIAGAILIGTLALAKTNPRAARITAAVVSLALLGRFAGSFFDTGKWYPAGIMMVASLFALVVLVGGHFVAMSQRKKETPA
jgi:uncharacterized membrane protein (UPF0136 family)